MEHEFEEEKNDYLKLEKYHLRWRVYSK